MPLPRVFQLLMRSTLIASFLIANYSIPVRGEGKKPSKTNPKRSSARPSAAGPVKGTVPYASRADAMAWADDMAQRRDLDPLWVRSQLGQARFLPGVPRLVLPPSTPSAKNWQAYRARFVEPIRIQAGLKFWAAHEHWLQRAETQYGVPAQIIVGILGVETLYGQQMGNYRVLDALATLAFDFPPEHPRAVERTRFFQGELEQFLSLHSRIGSNPQEPRGSFAGAMGLPQFMPSSWVRHAVDFDGDGRIDLFASPADAIGSVASYFRGHQWQPGMPTHYPVQFDPARLQLDTLLAPDILPSFSAERMGSLGVLLNDAGRAHTGPLALVELHNGGDTPSYVAGTENFYAITRYNWSSYYALAVIELGQAVQARRTRPDLP